MVFEAVGGAAIAGLFSAAPADQIASARPVRVAGIEVRSSQEAVFAKPGAAYGREHGAGLLSAGRSAEPARSAERQNSSLLAPGRQPGEFVW